MDSRNIFSFLTGAAGAGALAYQFYQKEEQLHKKEKEQHEKEQKNLKKELHAVTNQVYNIQKLIDFAKESKIEAKSLIALQSSENRWAAKDNILKVLFLIHTHASINGEENLATALQFIHSCLSHLTINPFDDDFKDAHVKVLEELLKCLEKNLDLDEALKKVARAFQILNYEVFECIDKGMDFEQIRSLSSDQLNVCLSINDIKPELVAKMPKQIDLAHHDLLEILIKVEKVSPERALYLISNLTSDKAQLLANNRHDLTRILKIYTSASEEVEQKIEVNIASQKIISVLMKHKEELAEKDKLIHVELHQNPNLRDKILRQALEIDKIAIPQPVSFYDFLFLHYLNNHTQSLINLITSYPNDHDFEKDLSALTYFTSIPQWAEYSAVKTPSLR